MNTTNFNSDVVVAAIVGFIIGALLIWIINYLSRKKNEEEDNATLQETLQELQALQKEYDQYRVRVNEHFTKTADSIDGLTKSYQQVFDHLSQGAQNLMDGEALQAQLAKRQNKAVTLAYLVEQERKTKQATQPSVSTTARPTAKPASASAKPAPQSDAMATKKQPTADTVTEGVKKTGAAVKAQPKSNVHIAAEKAGLKPISRPDKQAPVQQPEVARKPIAAKQSAPQSKPTAAQQPAPQNKPAAAQQPAPQSKPAVAQQPAPQSKPTAAQQSAPQSKPTAAQQPAPQSKSAAAQQPAPQSKPAAAQQPVPQNKPVAAQQPEAQGKPTAVKQSEPKTIQNDPHETAIEAVKKHIKQVTDEGNSK